MYAFLVLHAVPEMTEEEIRGAMSDWRRECLVMVREGGYAAILIGLRKGDHADTARELAVTLQSSLPISIQSRIGASGVYSGGTCLAQAYKEGETACQLAWYVTDRQPVMAYAPRQQRAADHEVLLPIQEALRTALKRSELELAWESLQQWVHEAGGVRLFWPELSRAVCEMLELLSAGVGHQPESPDRGRLLLPEQFSGWPAYRAALLDTFQERLHLLREHRHESRAVETVKAYLHEHFGEELDLHKLAERVHLTPSYLSKLFKSETGETITDYAISVRMEQAKRLLRERLELKTYEVGELSGYSDPAYFTKAFKRATGKTPKEYRESVR